MLNENSAPNGNLSWDDARLSDETAAAMRDLAGTVTDAPPLRLTAEAAAASRAKAARRGPRLAGWSWGVPVLAAVAVVAIAVALVIVRSIPNGRVPLPSPSAMSAAPVSPTVVAGVPEYYVAWMQADRPYLVVRNTLTGKQLARGAVAAGNLPRRGVRRVGRRPHVGRPGYPRAWTWRHD